jgi:transcription termination factor NusB
MSTVTQSQARNFSANAFATYENERESEEAFHDHIEEIPIYFHPRVRFDQELVDLEYLAHFVDGTAFYAEALEDEIGELLEDFWQAREHAHQIVTDLLLARLNERVMND